jgi:hypothetical protein
MLEPESGDWRMKPLHPRPRILIADDHAILAETLRVYQTQARCNSCRFRDAAPERPRGRPKN